MNTRDIGREAERIAVNYLKCRGYKILKTNWTCYAGEIDIIAFKNKLIFVEVKSSFSGFCSPCELFSFKKRKHLLRSINVFLLKYFQDISKIPEYRVDLVCVNKYNFKTLLQHYTNV